MYKDEDNSNRYARKAQKRLAEYKSRFGKKAAIGSSSNEPEEPNRYDDQNDPNRYWRRKQRRVAEHMSRFGKKLINCTACNGSGYYDNIGSPPCGACDGTGKQREA